ncbi:MAG: hypothetical protein IPJ30_03450 [Acidobacteria bacterium]|nr:hypothetical protein [Acidobacteriota bacterium]
MFFSSMFSEQKCDDPHTAWIIIAMILAYPFFGYGRQSTLVGNVTFWKWIGVVAILAVFIWIVQRGVI